MQLRSNCNAFKAATCSRRAANAPPVGVGLPLAIMLVLLSCASAEDRITAQDNQLAYSDSCSRFVGPAPAIDSTHW
jgi:hypothetical protein